MPNTDKLNVSRNVDVFPRSTQWSSSTVLCQLTRADICLRKEEIIKQRPMLWNDLCSEYDVQSFSRKLDKLGHKYSRDFLSFISAWQSDEWNHYLGFRLIFCLLYGEREDEVHQRVAGRTPKFLPISEFLADEFTICLLLAYDEIATTKSYSMDHELYRSMGNPAFLRWIKLVTRDEAFHFKNCMEVIAREHQQDETKA